MKPIECAQNLIKEFDISTTPALSLGRIYEHFNINCVELDFGDLNYMGSLHRRNDETVIIINTDIKNIGRINFTKSHELGHFCLKHKGKAIRCTKTDMSNLTKRPQEVEANQFASEFLLPEHMIKSISLTAPFDFDTITAISKNYMVSKLTTVFRVLDFHDGNYAFIGSKNGVITHSKVSNSLSGKIILKKSSLFVHNKSFACTCLTINNRMDGYSDIDPTVWIERNNTGSKISLKEYSRADKSSGSVMTLLKVEFL